MTHIPHGTVHTSSRCDTQWSASLPRGCEAAPLSLFQIVRCAADEFYFPCVLSISLWSLLLFLCSMCITFSVYVPQTIQSQSQLSLRCRHFRRVSRVLHMTALPWKGDCLCHITLMKNTSIESRNWSERNIMAATVTALVDENTCFVNDSQNTGILLQRAIGAVTHWTLNKCKCYRILPLSQNSRSSSYSSSRWPPITRSTIALDSLAYFPKLKQFFEELYEEVCSDMVPKEWNKNMVYSGYLLPSVPQVCHIGL